MRQLIAIVGWHNAGKTTLIEGLVQEYRRRGARVAVIKHSREGFDLDHPGTDTWRFAQAGADAVVITSREAVAWLERLDDEPRLEQLLARLQPDIDVVIAEGFKHEPCAKIEVMRAAAGTEPIARPEDLLAIVTDDVEDERPSPRFRPTEIVALVDFLENLGFTPRGQS